MKALYSGFNNQFSSNDSGFSIIAGGRRRPDTGAFIELDTVASVATNTITSANNYRFYRFGNSTVVVAPDFWAHPQGASLRLLRNSPTGANNVTYTSGLFTTDITAAARQIPISFGRTVCCIRVTSENALTAVEAKLHNSAGAAVATLITAKTVSAGATMVFNVLADHAALLQDGTVRVTASGNSGAAVGMNIEVLTVKTV